MQYDFPYTQNLGGSSVFHGHSTNHDGCSSCTRTAIGDHYGAMTMIFGMIIVGIEPCKHSDWMYERAYGTIERQLIGSYSTQMFKQ